MNSTTRLRGLLTVPKLAGFFSAATGLLVLFGWTFDIPSIRSVLPGAVQMKANTATALLCAGISLAVGEAPASRWRNLFAQALGVFVSLIGLATVSQYAFGWNLGIDQLLFKDRAIAFNVHPGRMSPYTASVFSVLGIGLAAATTRFRWPVWASAGLSLLVGGISVAGYLWNASELVTDRYVPPVAIHTALSLLALGIGLFSGTVGGRKLDWLSEYSRVELRTLGGFTAMFVLAFAIGGYTYRAAVEAVDAANWVAHTQKVRAAISHLSSLVLDAELAQRDYFLTGNPARTQAFEAAAEKARSVSEALRDLVSDNAAQKGKALELKRAISDRLDALRRLNESFQRDGGAAMEAAAGHAADASVIENIRALLKSIDANEAALLAARESAASENKVKTLLLLLSTLALSLAGFLALFAGIHREMGRRMQGERLVRERSGQLEEANKELESFSYSVSHDLRAPLRHVQGYVEMLKRSMEGQLPEKAARYLGIIQQSSVDMGRLIDDLLAFSRLGRQDLRMDTVPLGPIVAGAIELAKHDVADRAIEWKVAEMPSVLGDASLLKQVFANLVGNAVKYSRGRNPAEIEIGIANREKDEIIFFVKDNGAGFEMAYAQKLFGVFQRLHTPEEFEGTGIGLAIVRRIIARHGGRTWAEGAIDKGATFYFSLAPQPSDRADPA